MDIVDVEKAEIPTLPGYYVDKNALVYHGDKMMSVIPRNGLYNYVRITVKQNGKYTRRMFNTVKLMAVAWLGAKDKDVVCFKDKDQTHTTLDNIYIGTKGQFMRDNYEFKKHNGLTNDRRLLRNEYRSNTEIYQIEPETKKVVNVFKSLHEASEYLDLPIASLERCCFNPAKTCCNYHWCFAYDYENRVR